jgi:class 3 adenylate cyclase/tetratricopeptide (TPR) repeat protein
LKVLNVDIDDWLRSIGLAQYAQTFHDNAIDVSILPDLTDQDLEKMGVLLGHRRKMLRAIAGFETIERSAPPVAIAAPPPATPYPPETASRRQLTIMFCDLVGSTALSTRLDPEDMHEIVVACQRCFADLVTGASGFIARYMGDGILAYFGYPKAHEHDAERAVRAGLALVEAVPKLKTAAGVPLQVRVGIATGLVVVGEHGAGGDAHEQGVVGETPNLAARLQALAEPGTVVISSGTRSLTGGLFDYRDLGTVELKGFAETVQAWQVLCASITENRFEALRARTTPLVNRVEEIDLLLRRWRQAKLGEGAVVLISGEAGIGKSRIAETIIERVSGEPHTQLRQLCSPHHQDTALYPSIAQLERAAGFRRDDTEEQRLAKLEAVLAQATDRLGESVPLLAGLLSVPTSDRYPMSDLTPQQRREKTLRALLEQAEGLAARQPLLLSIEDVHWADPTSLELIELIIDRAASLPLLAILTFRPEFVPPWIGRPQVTLITLNRLPRRLRAEMIGHVTGGKVLPQEIADQIADRTDGVPLFIEELTKAVVESDLLVEADDRYLATAPITALAIPTSLQASLLARLDRLAPISDVVQIAAALGRHFSHELISAVAAVPRQELNDALAQLVNAGLIFRRGAPPDAEYTFKHALVQDTAYGTLLRGRRRQIHARIVATLEDQYADIVAAQPALLAQHCKEAGLVEKVVVYWLKAGRQSSARSATTEAAAQLRKGLDALDGLPGGPERRQHELDLQLALGWSLMATKGFSSPEVDETFARARTLTEQIDRPEYLWRLLLGQWVFHSVRGEHRIALSLAERVEKIGEAWDDVKAQWRGHRANGRTRLYLGDFVGARALLERCHQLADPSHRVYALVLADLAWALEFLGYVDQARSRLNEALLGARGLRHAQTLADVLVMASAVELVIGSPEVERHAEELSALSTEYGLPFYLGWATVLRGLSLTSVGRGQEALSLITGGIAGIRATGTVTGTPTLLVESARAYGRLGQPVEGLDCLTEAARIIEMTGERCYAAEMHRCRGDLLNATGNLSEAEQSYHEALSEARLKSAKLLELKASISLARLQCARKRRGEARDLLAPIYCWFTEGFDVADLKEAKALLEELHA